MPEDIDIERRTARWRADGGADVTVYCLPHAGGGAATARALALAAPPGWDVVGIRLPGREQRLAEQPVCAMGELAADVAATVRSDPRRAPNVVLIGQCFGAALAVTVAGLLGDGAPVGLAGVVAASPPESTFLNGAAWVDAADTEFLTELDRLGGVPAAVLADEELLELVLPVLRSDVAALHSIAGTAPAVLDVPVVAVGGIGDPLHDERVLAEWVTYGRGGWSARADGGHFLLGDAPATLAAEIGALLRRHGN
ncbi:thioesterase II family protein [Catellatospora chokoriensis]|uniref:Thioesterase domain-containing protein n=1 Tax=Catellatospora chokoriensis TaxID=310353 RepID=A0A8J3NS97_9ACTN|nr:thioesterase domain-containing protein [Catellatospora chokoriensis]GIF90311.1 hypothetical protein Cch02nite_37550 [Catellatospora chokoriensis]